jgi:hypothetical protein
MTITMNKNHFFKLSVLSLLFIFLTLSVSAGHIDDIGTGHSVVGEHGICFRAADCGGDPYYCGPDKKCHVFGEPIGENLPEFSAIGLGLAALGGLGSYTFYRKKKS